MVINTNLGKVRFVAEAFLDVDICETKVPFVASHPFTSSWAAPAIGEMKLLDLHNEEEQKIWRESLRKEIKKSSLFQIFMMLNKPYILQFLTYIEEYLSDEDLGEVLGSWWTHVEQISLDKSLTGDKLVKMFKRADKTKLMDEDDRKVYEELPDMVTIYRGVTSYNKKATKAFSWTLDRKVAEWFANRFDTGTGEIWTMTVPKERILCSFAGRGESEVIVNLYRYKDMPKKIVEKV